MKTNQKYNQPDFLSAVDLLLLSRYPFLMPSESDFILAIFNKVINTQKNNCGKRLVFPVDFVVLHGKNG